MGNCLIDNEKLSRHGQAFHWGPLLDTTSHCSSDRADPGIEDGNRQEME